MCPLPSWLAKMRGDSPLLKRTPEVGMDLRGLSPSSEIAVARVLIDNAGAMPGEVARGIVDRSVPPRQAYWRDPFPWTAYFWSVPVLGRLRCSCQ